MSKLKFIALALATTGSIAAPMAGYASTTYSVVTANEQAASLSIVSPERHAVRTVHLSVEPHNVQSSRDGHLLLVAGSEVRSGSASMAQGMSMNPQERGYLLLMDAASLQKPPSTRVFVGSEPAHVIVDDANRFAYVTVSGNDAVKVVDLQQRAVVSSIATGDFPHGLRMSSDGRKIFVANMKGGSVSEIDVTRRSEAARIPVGRSPVQVAIAPDGLRVYVTVAGENAVAVIDTVAKKVVAKVPVGRNPAQVFISPDGERLYVANQGTPSAPDHTVSVIDTRTLRTLKVVDVGRGAHGVVATADGSRVYVTDAFSNQVTAISARSLSVIGTYAVGKGPNGVTTFSAQP